MTRWLPASFLVLSLAVSPLYAQEARSFGEVVDVEVVNLEVYATNKNGDPVMDLGRDDFELFANGERVEITNFYTVESGRRGGASEPSIDPIFLVVFVDNVHVGQFTRNRVLRDLRGFLRQRLDQGDRVMLVSFDGGMRVHQAFTREWEPLDKALSAMQEEPGYGHLRERERLGTLEFMMSFADTTFRGTRCPDELERMARSYSQQAYNQVHASVSGLEEFISTLASLPGRKALLYVNDGIPFQPGIGIHEFLFQYCDAAGDVSNPGLANPPVVEQADSGNRVGGGAPVIDTSRALGVTDPALNVDTVDVRQTALTISAIQTTSLFEDLNRSANAHRVTFFPIEAYGPRALSASQARVREGRTLSRRADEARWMSLQDSFNAMADETGGRATLNTTDFGPALALVGRDLGTYYSLGYRLPKSDDDQTFRVDVKVKRPRVRIRHRKSLRSQSLSSELVGRTQAALMYGVVDNPLSIAVATGDMQPMGDDMHMVPIRVSIPLGKVTLLPEAGSHRGHLKLYLAGRDRNGRLAEVRTAEIPITIPSDQVETARQKLYLYEVRMLMRQGDHTVAVGLHDEIGAVASFMAEDVLVSRN